MEEQGLPINGAYVRLILVPASDAATSTVHKLAEVSEPLIVSTLMPHETKLSVNHYRIKRIDDDQNPVQSKSILEFHVGFRRFLICPMISEQMQVNNKAKYHRFIPNGMNLLASSISQICMPPGKVMVFRRDEAQVPRLFATGVCLDPDPMKIVLKRILLTGYPM